MGPLDGYRLRADAWLGEMLGRPAWTVVQAASGPPLAELTASRAHFATAKMPATDVAAVEAFEGLGFHAVDMALTFDVERVDIAAQGARVRWAQPGDRAAVEAIASSAFRFSRFHLDTRLPKAVADKIKAAWAGNWFAGKRGDGMVVAEQTDGALAGFLQLRWAPENRLMIDLIAVQPDSFRKGYARAMIGFAALKGTGDARLPRGMTVGTQAANIPSIRLYESLGFRLRDASFVLHHHGGAR